MGLTHSLVKPKDYIVGICSPHVAKHAALRRKSKDWLARNQDNVSLLEQWVFKSTTFSRSNKYQLYSLGLDPPGLEPTIYHFQSEHAYIYTTYVVLWIEKTEKFTGSNKVLLVLGRSTGAHREDYKYQLYSLLVWPDCGLKYVQV
jgi:hypothetical protein